MAEEAATLIPDNFDDVFAALAEDDPEALQSLDDAPEEVEEEEEVAEDTVAEADEEPVEEDAEEPEEEVEASDAEVEEEADEEPEEEPAAEAEQDTLARLAEMIANTQKSAPAEEKAPEPKQEAEEADIYTEEEHAILADYEKDWSDVSRGEALKRRAEYKQIVDYVFNEISSHLMPVMQTVQSLSERTHLQDLQSAVGDYDVVRDDVVQWVDTQPEYLQEAYKRVINNGTVDEVADLIDRYKAETGRVQQPQQTAAAQPARKKETELPATTKQAAASLAPVSSKRSVVPQGDDPNDFESAFASFAGKL